MSPPAPHRRRRSNGAPAGAPPDVLDGAWLEEAVDRAAASLVVSVQRSPYRTLGAALGVGVVVGGGAWSGVARSLVALGARLALSALVPALLDRVQPTAPPEDAAAGK